MFKDRLKAVACIFISINILALSIVSVVSTLNRCSYVVEDSAFMSVFSVFPNGSVDYKESDTTPVASVQKPKNDNKSDNSVTKIDDKISESGQTYPIEELQISAPLSFDNFSVKNSTSYDLDIEDILGSELPFDIADTRQAQVLIVHTHTCESYMSDDNGYYYEDFYPRTTDNNKNVTKVGEAIASALKSHGIGVVHSKVQHDSPSYDGAYARSYDTITDYLDKYSEIKVVLDIHRDSMTKDDSTKLKPTFTYKSEKAAQIMIMTGCDATYTDFPTWEDNLNFALKLQSTAETMYPGITRPLNFGNFTYNMNANSGSLLIEVGTDANTLDEAVRTGQMLGNALAQVLQK